MLASLKKYSIPDILLLLILITLPLQEHWNSKALLITLIYAGFKIYQNFRIEFPKIAWVYILFAAFTGISIIWSQDKEETSKAVVRLALPFLLFVLAYKQFFNFKSINKILRLAAITFVFYGLIWIVSAIIRYTQSHSIGTFYYHELTAPIGASAIYIALIFGQLYLFLLYRCLFVKGKYLLLDALLAVLLFVFQILLSSKMILSMLIIISLLFFIYYLKNIKFSKKTLFSGILLGLSIVFLFGFSPFTKKRFEDILEYKQIENVFEQDYFGPGYYWNGLSLRLFQMRCFYEIEKEASFNTLLGTGLKASQPLLVDKYEQYDLYAGPIGSKNKTGYFAYNFHNQYSQLIIELGMFGVILILLIMYFFFIQPLRQKNILLFGSSLLFLFFALTETFLLRQKGIVSFVLFPLLAIYFFKNQNIIEPATSIKGS